MFQIRKPGFPVKATSKQKLKHIADLFRLRIRESFGDYGTFCPIADALEMLGQKSFEQFSFAVVADNNPMLVGKWACTNPSDKCIYISESVYRKACENNPQARFTVAHELGHLLLGHEYDAVFARANVNAAIPTYRDSEWQADTFAAYLLMPSEQARGKSAAEIETLFGVSASAAVAREARLMKHDL